jgi:hypothetical protein
MGSGCGVYEPELRAHLTHHSHGFEHLFDWMPVILGELSEHSRLSSRNRWARSAGGSAIRANAARRYSSVLCDLGAPNQFAR